ncbi:glycolate oxidase [Desulfitispora alkaliphila]|uniref:FAD-binding oxidoreductase n=1 Tax=Desulfitispora alkaliphila TaxID=622674 RepID=UPI003D1C5561
MKEAVIRELERIVGRDNVTRRKEELMGHGYDATLKEYQPEIVVLPKSTDEVASILKLANREKVPVISRGAGTNLSGGTVALTGGIVLSMTKMNRILEIDTKNAVAVVEPGVVNADLQEVLEPTGYYFRPDPASMKACTMGGNVAECSGGPRCLKYGVTRDYVRGLEVVLASGEVIQTGSKNKRAADGLDLTKLLVGSEGTLGVFTKIILEISPISESKKTMLCVFGSIDDASKTVAHIIGSGIIPTTLELMDNLLINCAEDHTGVGLPRDAAAILLIEVDGYLEDLSDQVKTIGQICESNNVKDFTIATSADQVNKLWLARRTVIGALARKRPSYSMQDVTVPRSKMPSMVAEVVQVSKKYDLPIGVLAHAGDGNLHPLVLFDERDKEEVDKVHHAEIDICKSALELGGTLSGEHGIGTLKRPYLDLEFSQDAIDLMKGIKRVFDPNNILNPGKIVEVDAS